MKIMLKLLLTLLRLLTKATFKQDGSRIKGETFKGDVYVEYNNFELVDGNIYFKTQQAKDSLKLDNTSKVMGNTEVK